MSYRYCGCLLVGTTWDGSISFPLASCIYSLRLLMMEGETVRNMWSVSKWNKFEILCIWLDLLQKYKTLKNSGKYRQSVCHSHGIIVTILLRIRLSREKSVSVSCRPFRFFLRLYQLAPHLTDFRDILHGRLLMNICRESSYFVKIGQKYRAQYVEI